MRKASIMLLAGLMACAVCGLIPAQAQNEPAKSSPAPAKAQTVQPYRLDFAFNELADGKIVNTRHYSMNLTAGERDEVKIGTRVPVPVGSNPNAPTSQFQYMDVGTRIWAKITFQGEDLVLTVQSEVSNLDLGSGTEHSGQMPPVVRQIKIEGDTLLVVGKPMLVGSVDDPNSKRQFQLEVTVTKLR